jgi:chromosome segregation ATPase
MDGKDKTARERKQRLRERRESAGLAQISGWVPVARRSYAREVLRAVAEGANSLPPDPELVAALETAREEVSKARTEIEARDQALQEAREREASLEAERDAAKAAEAAAREQGQAKALEAGEAARSARDAGERAREALERAQKAEAAIQQAKSLPGLRGRLVRWIAGDVLD